MKQYLSWDCANKTLAWSLLEIDTHIYSKLSMLGSNVVSLYEQYLGPVAKKIMLGEKLSHADQTAFTMALYDPVFVHDILYLLQAINCFIDDFATYISSGVADTLCGKAVRETSDIERTMQLHKFLTNSNIAVPRLALLQSSAPVKVIIEHQPSRIGEKTNTKSTMVAHQLAFYYIEYSPIFISPKFKNQIALADNLGFQTFVDYETNRGRSGRDMMYSARKKHSKANFLYFLKTFGLESILCGLSKSVFDDLADSTMQVFAYLVKNKQFI